MKQAPGMAMRIVFGMAALVLSARAVHAQPYVAGSLSADVARYGRADTTQAPGTGEAFSFSLRTGASVTPSFGVELDFTRPTEITTDEEPDVRILEYTRLALDGLALPASFPSSIVAYRQRTEQRITTYTASLWARQEVSPRFSLVYLGGVAFARVDRTVSTTINYSFVMPAIYPPSYDFDTVEYTQGPMVGIEGRIALTEHAHLVPGLRLMALGGGWVMRPAVGLSWTF